MILHKSSNILHTIKGLHLSFCSMHCLVCDKIEQLVAIWASQ